MIPTATAGVITKMTVRRIRKDSERPSSVFIPHPDPCLTHCTFRIAQGLQRSGNTDAQTSTTKIFSRPSAASARVIAHGRGFFAPISAALLSDVDLVVGNGDINIAHGQTPNLLFEISPALPG